jgi:gas vesicle protein
MKRMVFVIAIALVSCNVNVDKQNDKDSASGFDSSLKKMDDKLEQWGDSAKEKFKDIKQDVKDRWDKDSATHKHK